MRQFYSSFFTFFLKKLRILFSIKPVFKVRLLIEENIPVITAITGNHRMLNIFSESS